MTRTKTTPATKTELSTMFEIVIYALLAKGRMKSLRPVAEFGNGLGVYDVADFYLVQHPTGWVATIAFDNPTAGAPNTLDTPVASPYPTERLAYYAGASLLCLLLTGSPELPFIESNGKLVVAGYGTGGHTGPFSMCHPVPWT